MEKTADLHIHSDFSDSTFNLDEIFLRAQKEGLSCISITDHDTFAAYPQAFDKAKAFGLEILRGVEFSSHIEGEEVHILAYFPQKVENGLNDILCELKKERKVRLLGMAKNLSQLGLEIDLDDFSRYLGEVSASRLHLARYLKEKEKVSSLKDAFLRYIGKDSPVYSGRFRYATKEAIGLLKECGGRTFLAHPLNLSSPQLVEEIIQWGVDGLEVFYPTHSQDVIAELLALASHRNLLVSGGSDCHGLAKKYIGIGRIHLDYNYVARIKNGRS